MKLSETLVKVQQISTQFFSNFNFKNLALKLPDIRFFMNKNRRSKCSPKRTIKIYHRKRCQKVQRASPTIERAKLLGIIISQHTYSQ